MKRQKLKSKKGRSLIEMVLYMALLLVIGITLFSLAGSGSETYVRLSQKDGEDTSLRTALAFLDKGARKNDRADSPLVLDCPEGGSALVYTSLFGTDVYETWIYCKDGMMYELLKNKNDVFDHGLASQIIEIDGIGLEFSSPSLLKMTVTRSGRSLTGYVYLRSGRNEN